ncbi:MAG: type II toxin-antitoxin system RelE/ParE family toxin [Epsilonproteobacteria bacterium]|nr:type II toxin-antitoxin system RelE/ParE family toxin [Campylobacterota bacterium]
MYKVKINKQVLKDIKHIDKKYKKKIIETIEEKIAKEPYKGKKLAGNLSPFYRWRVGDYRIIYSINDDIIEVEIIKVSHRQGAYK